MQPRAATAARAQQIAEEAADHFSRPADQRPALFVPRSHNAMPDVGSNLGFTYESIEDAFPTVAPGCAPLGNMVLLQIRQPLSTSSGGFIIDGEMRKTELDNCQVAKVIAIGTLAFHSRDTGTLWPEGAWCAVGDYVRLGKYQGDRWAMPYQHTVREFDDATDRFVDKQVTDRTVFLLIKDLAIMGKYETAADALAAKAFL
jgi:co-chaperonin GroES (HSP10)